MIARSYQNITNMNEKALNKENYINSINLKDNTEFPYLVLDVINDDPSPRNPGFRVMHWHEDLQFIFVLSGKIEVQMLAASVQICAGEGIFINRNVVHLVRRLGNCHYNSFLFPAYFLGFYTGSPAQDLVDSITTDERSTFLHFTSTLSWHREVTKQLQRLSQLEKNKSDLYVYEVLACLSCLWLTIRKHIDPPKKQRKSTLHLRMQKILRFIEDHYAEDITLTDLSKCANISRSECSRCFKLSMNTTPYKYLTEYRLSKAAQLLTQTDEAIGSIATAVGFRQMSNFGQCFKAKTGYTPRAYREIISET